MSVPRGPENQRQLMCREEERRVSRYVQINRPGRKEKDLSGERIPGWEGRVR